MRTLTDRSEILARLADLFQADHVFDVARDGDYAAGYLADVRINGVRYYCRGTSDMTSPWHLIADDRIVVIAASPNDSDKAKYAYTLDGNAKTYTSYHDDLTKDVITEVQLQIDEGRFVLSDTHGDTVISTLQRRAQIAAAGLTGLALTAAGLAVLVKLRRKHAKA
jgi:hypothetical protein